MAWPGLNRYPVASSSAFMVLCYPVGNRRFLRASCEIDDARCEGRNRGTDQESQQRHHSCLSQGLQPCFQGLESRNLSLEFTSYNGIQLIAVRCVLLLFGAPELSCTRALPTLQVVSNTSNPCKSYSEPRKLEHRCRRIHAGIPYTFKSMRLMMFQLSGVYCTPLAKQVTAPP